MDMQTLDDTPETRASKMLEDPVCWLPSLVFSTTEGEAHGVFLRALCPDNRGDAKKIVQLFTSYYDAGFPFDGVFDTEYWHSVVSSLEDCFVSIAADEGGELISHLGLRFDQDRSRVEVIYPAIRPDSAAKLRGLSQLFWEKLTRLASRQQWSSMYQYSLLSETTLQAISSKYFDSFEMAIIPELGASATAGGRAAAKEAALLMYRFFAPSSSKLLYLYPPARHIEKIQELYAPLKLQRIFAAGSDSNGVFATDETSELSESSWTLRGRFGVSEMVLSSRRKESAEAQLTEVKEEAARNIERGQQVLLRIRLDDPACPSFCEKAERQLGFRLCGIQPGNGSGDYLLYTKFSTAALRGLNIFTQRGKELQQYLVSNS